MKSRKVFLQGIIMVIGFFLMPIMSFATTLSQEPTVAIRLFGDDQVAFVQVSHDVLFNTSEKYNYSSDKSVLSWNICFPFTTCSSGLKTVYVRYLDNNGQILGTAIQQINYQKPVPKKKTAHNIPVSKKEELPVQSTEVIIENIQQSEPQKKLIGGCTNKTAKNYILNTDYDDGSCVYRRQLFDSQKLISAGIVAGVVQTIFLFTGFGIKLLELPLIISRFSSQFLVFIGARKKPKHWGSVIDSISGAGLDPVVVTLFNQDNQEIRNCITDIEGRFGFLVPMGNYRLIAQKTHYQFPADHGYQGGWFTIDSNDITAIDIPLKKIGNDWNEQEKKHILPFWKIYRKSIQRIFFVLLIGSLLYSLYNVNSNPIVVNIISVVLNSIFVFLSIITRQVRSFGIVYTKNSHIPVSGTIHITHSTMPSILIKKVIIDEQGRYYCILPKGHYQVSIINTAGEEIHTEQVIVRDSILKKDLAINSLL